MRKKIKNKKPRPKTIAWDYTVADSIEAKRRAATLRALEVLVKSDSSKVKMLKSVDIVLDQLTYAVKCLTDLKTTICVIED